MVEVLLLVGVAVAAFVGFNIGGSSTGVAFGPAVGSGAVSKFWAAALMTGFALLGGWTVGRNVVDTMGGEIVPQGVFTPEATIAVLFFVGTALLVSNLFGVPASTSMTAVGAIAGLGVARGTVDWGVMSYIVSWWVVSPVLAFWVSGVVGRYLYPSLVERIAVARTDGPLLRLDRSAAVPRPALGPGTTRREAVGTGLVVLIACYMAFSAGASNVANAVAPLVGNGALTLDEGILLGAGAIGVGAFTIARRTLDTVGNDLTEMPLTAALVVATVSSTIITGLSQLGVPASFVVVATMSIVGLGWGRATRTATLADTAGGDRPGISVGALAADAHNAPTVGSGGGIPTESVPAIGEESRREMPTASDLFEPGTTARVILLQNLVPAIATVTSYVVFLFAPL